MTAPPPPPSGQFLGFDLFAGTTHEFMELVINCAAAREAPWTVTYLNAATVNFACDNAAHAFNLNKFDCLYADGMAVVWAARWRGATVTERVNAGDFTDEFMRRVAARDLKIALIGGRPGEAEKAAAVFRGWAPELKIVMTEHGFVETNDAALTAKLEASDPDIVLLGMGSPKQEIAALAWSAAGRPRVWWCVGALFEYYAGTRRRAPRWVRAIGMEWAVRLLLEPRRLWRRYMLGNPLFIFRVLRGTPPRGLGKK